MQYSHQKGPVPFGGAVQGAGFGHRRARVWCSRRLTLSDLLASWNVSGGSGQACKIKGNISIDPDERIFHVPGQRYYAQTKISPQYGEWWFCSEFEAWTAGWRKSKA